MTTETLESYVDAMRDASSVISQINPDYLVAPMLGSIPFIDAMAIVDSDFDFSKVIYMPASSRIKDIKNVIKNWYYNFLKDVVDSPFYFPRVLGIDEVVSGLSVTRCFRSIDLASSRLSREIKQILVEKLHSNDLEESLQALRDGDILTENQYSDRFSLIRERLIKGTYREHRDLAKQDTALFLEAITSWLDSKLKYKTVGIEDSKIDKRQKEYEKIKGQGRIIPIGIQTILTMDNPDFSPARLERLNGNGKTSYVQFSPVVQDFKITKQYVDFLSSLASYVGKDLSKVSPVNMGAILDSSKYL